MATFMYYPGHASNNTVTHPVSMMQQQQHQQCQNYAGLTNQGAVNAYGYYQPMAVQPPVQPPIHPISHQQAFYNQGLAPPVQQHHHHPQTVHRHSASFQQTALPPMGMFYGAPAAPLLPPLAIEEPAGRDEYVNGGVNQYLDYDLDLIADFVVKNAYIAFGTDSNTIIRETNSKQGVDIFTKGVSSVLNATRLPSVTIFLAIDLLNKYISKLPQGCQSIGGRSVNVIYQNMMVAFVLANKFNDDKTFTNKSWTQATGMTLASINDYEREWLQVFEWRLFQDKFALYENFAHCFEVFCQEKRCPSPPNLLPTPHSTDNYLSPLSGCQTPVQLNSTMYSSPCYYDEDSNNFLYGSHSRMGMISSSPAKHATASSQNAGSGNFNRNYYQYGLQNSQLNQLESSFSPNRPWNVDDRFHSHSKFPQMDNNYYCYSAVY